MQNTINMGLLGLQMNTAIFVLAIVLCVIAGAVVGILLFRMVFLKKINNAKCSASKIIEDAHLEAKTIQKEARLSAQEESLRIKTETENELKVRRNEIEKLNNRYLQREEFINNREQSLDNKNENLEKFKEKLEAKEKALASQEDEITAKKVEADKVLERNARMSQEEAKELLIKQMTEEAKRDANVMIKQITDDAYDNAHKTATEIICNAIQKYSADLTSEATITTITLPNDEMKGRLIGREGRNIKALEQATGIDLIIDDTPEVIVVSGFDPIRREVARLSINKLMQDGRIHPGRIEEIVAKTRKDLEHEIKEAGESAVMEVGIIGLHSELVKIMGRLKYRTSYGQNVLKHSIEVAYLAGMMAAELGCDEKIARRGGFLHDIGKAVDHEQEGTHVSIGVQLARKYKENDKVINCIEAHHGDVEFTCVEAMLVQAADAISSSRPGARRESLESYIHRLQKLEEIANSFKGVDKAYAIQAGREIRVAVKPELISDADMDILSRDIAKAIEEQMEYPGVIKVNVIREMRSVNFAK